MRLTGNQRLQRQTDFDLIRTKGFKRDCGYFIFRAIIRPQDSPLEYNRIGIVVSRKVGNAVKRNYAKRVFRQIFQRYQTILPKYTDIVIVVRKCFDGCVFEELQKRFLSACNELSA